jgi:hypothetical protein
VAAVAAVVVVRVVRVVVRERNKRRMRDVNSNNQAAGWSDSTTLFLLACLATGYTMQSSTVQYWTGLIR